MVEKVSELNEENFDRFSEALADLKVNEEKTFCTKNINGKVACGNVIT
jgi:hypothetical protein